MPKISIIVPVFNAECYLVDSIASLQNQTLRDIEIILIEDCSNDSSKEIINELSKNDSRISVIYNDVNRGTSKSRKSGVEYATGEYILFMDSDDEFEINACEKLYDEIRKHDVDILQFGTIIHNCSNAVNKTLENLEKTLKPYNKRINEKSLINSCFKSNLFGFTLWNKIYKAAVCKKAFSHISDDHLTLAEDLYAAFLIMLYSQSYIGIPDKYHNYYFGRGVTGNRKDDITHFRKLSGQGRIFKLLKDYLLKINKWEEYKEAYQITHNTILSGCIYTWHNVLDKDYTSEGFDALVNDWGNLEVITTLAAKDWNKYELISKNVHNSRCLESDKKEIKCIGIYYHRLFNGGVERLISLLAKIWDELGYRIVIFTDAEPFNDYELPPSVERVVIDNWKKHKKEDFYNRAKHWIEYMDKYEIDVMAYNAWLSRSLLWDMLTIKSCNVKFLISTQSIFTSALILGGSYFSQMPYIYALSDAVASLSRVDKMFWEKYCKSVYQISNPPTFDVGDMRKSELNDRIVLWVGRIAPEKNPHDVIEIMSKVVESVPDAKLYMVGTSEKGKIEAELNDKIKKLSLENNIELLGFQEDVDRYYEWASAVLLTSSFEGFSYVIAESKAHGVPYVGYELPYLEFERDPRGKISHPQKDINGVASSISEVLLSESYRKKLGKESYQSFLDYTSTDFKKMWADIFSDIEKQKSAPKLIECDKDYNETETIYNETLIEHIKIATQNIEKSNRKSWKKYKKVKKSKSYRLGRLLTLPVRIPRRMKKIASKYVNSIKQNHKKNKNRKYEEHQAKLAFDKQKKLLEHAKKIPSSDGIKYFEKIDINIGIIGDEFILTSYRDVANTYYITPQNWQDYIGKLDVFLIISTWTGLDHEWDDFQLKESEGRKLLEKLIDKYKKHGCKIVFYSMEDPPHYYDYLGIAMKSEYIFTSAYERVDQYKEDCKNNNVWPLTFAINPKVHNPIGSINKYMSNGALFAGTNYPQYEERKRDMQNIFDGIIDSGKELTVIDRSYGSGKKDFEFPKKYISNVIPKVPHSDLQKIHKLYDWSINLNSIKYSRTMFAMRAYELLGLGSLVISNYTIGVNDLLPCISIAPSKEEAKLIVNGFSDSEIYERKMSNVRFIYKNDTFYHRMEYILNNIGINYQIPSRSVAIIVEKATDENQENVKRQTYKNIEIIEKDNFSMETFNNVDMVTFFDDSMFYDMYYIEDMVNGFKYTSASYITKDSYFNEQNKINGIEHDYVNEYKSKYRTIFWTGDFSYNEISQLPNASTLDNGYSIDALSYNEQSNIIEKEDTFSPLLTVIVPVYNNGTFLYNKAFASLLRSSMFSDMEILLIDDGSTDRYTLQIVDKLERQYRNVKTYYFPTGGSGSASRPRNKGISLARADYITYLDPDNEAINDGYHKCYEVISKNNCDIIIGDTLHLADKENSYGTYGIYRNQAKDEVFSGDKKAFLQRVNYWPFNMQSSIIKKDLIVNSELYQVEGGLGEDTLFAWMLLLNSSTICFNPTQMTIYYSMVTDSVTNKINASFFKKSFIVEKAQKEELSKYGLLKSYIAQRYEILLYQWIFIKLRDVIKTDLSDALDYIEEIINLYFEKYDGDDYIINNFTNIRKTNTDEQLYSLILEKINE